MTMPTIHRILTTTALCLAAGAAYGASEPFSPEQAEQAIRKQGEQNQRLRYNYLSYKGSLRECRAEPYFPTRARTTDGSWIALSELPADTLVFRGDKFPEHKRRRVKGGVKGGAAYFFCNPETGELMAYGLMK